MVVHPGNTWYGGIIEEHQMDEVLDALESGETAGKYVISD
jgi:hypothetical protein